MARNCIEFGVEEAQGMERLGILRLIGSSRRGIDKFKEKFNINGNFKDADKT